MATNYSVRLAKLQERRQGDGLAEIFKGTGFASAYRSQATDIRESYEDRGHTDAIRYALGSMQSLPTEYTKTSIREGDRVKYALKNHLTNKNIS